MDNLAVVSVLYLMLAVYVGVRSYKLKLSISLSTLIGLVWPVVILFYLALLFTYGKDKEY